MFDLSLEKLFILAVVALFVLGPQRLPMAASWLAKTIRRIRDFANDANRKLRSPSAPNSTRSASRSAVSIPSGPNCNPGWTRAPR